MKWEDISSFIYLLTTMHTKQNSFQINIHFDIYYYLVINSHIYIIYVEKKKKIETLPDKHEFKIKV